MKDPMIYVVKDQSYVDGAGKRRELVALRFEGGDLAEGWTPRSGQVAWCEVSIWIDEDRQGGHVGSYGGEVWPGAWPAYFEIGPRGTHGQTTRLTDRGLQVAIAAIDGIAGAALYV